MWTKKIVQTLGLVLIAAGPLELAAQQLYECNWIVTIREIKTYKADGSYTITWEYDRAEVCRPISPT